DLNGDASVDRDTLPPCGLETNLFGGADCGLVESMPQLSDDAQHPNLIRGGEFDFEYYRALDSERLGLVRVTRLRLEQKLDRRVAEGGAWRGGRSHRRRRSDFAIKSPGRHGGRRQCPNGPSRGRVAKSSGHDSGSFTCSWASGCDSLERADAYDRRLPFDARDG